LFSGSTSAQANKASGRIKCLNRMTKSYLRIRVPTTLNFGSLLRLPLLA
jgi:hypothetical protein